MVDRAQTEGVQGWRRDFGQDVGGEERALPVGPVGGEKWLELHPVVVFQLGPVPPPTA